MSFALITFDLKQNKIVFYTDKRCCVKVYWYIDAET